MIQLGSVSFLNRPGPGPCIVFLHGIGSNARSFEPVFQLLPNHLNLIAWNAPGYLGSSPLREATPEPRHYARALADFMDVVKIKRASIVGHSLGTLMAAEFARMCPDRVEALILAASANGYGMQPDQELPEKAAARIADLEKLGPTRFAQARAGNLLHDPEGHPDQVAAVAAEMAQVNAVGYAQAVHMLASGNLKAVMPDVLTRPGFIIGTEDRVTPMDQTIAASDAWAAAHGKQPSVAVIEGAGHAVHVQKPTEFVNALMQHLERAGVCSGSATTGETHAG